MAAGSPGKAFVGRKKESHNVTNDVGLLQEQVLLTVLIRQCGKHTSESFKKSSQLEAKPGC